MYRWSTYLLLRLRHSVSCTRRQEAECSTWEQQHTADEPACILQTPPLSSHHSQYKLSQCLNQDALYLSNPLRLDPTPPTDPRNHIILSGHARLANQRRGRRVLSKNEKNSDFKLTLCAVKDRGGQRTECSGPTLIQTSSCVQSWKHDVWLCPTSASDHWITSPTVSCSHM